MSKLTMKTHDAFLITALLIMITQSVWSQSKNTLPWNSDQGNGTYRNPVLYADYSDPDVIRVGKDYYLTASSFNCSPGLPVLHSKDLVNWKIINYALPKLLPTEVYDKPQHGKGVWAPAIRFHHGEFYIYYPDPDYGIYVLKTRNPYGKWSKPHLVLKGKGIIDPCPFWDEDGKAYLITGWASSRAGVNSLLTLYKMDISGSHVIDEGQHIYDGHHINHTIEGPKLYKKDNIYYIFAPAGGVTTGWQLVLRSKNIYGPYEEKVVMDQGATLVNGPHQGAWVRAQNGKSWFIHFQDKGPYGRVVHLQPMSWRKGWPVIGLDPNGDGKGEPVLSYRKPIFTSASAVDGPVVNDEFNGRKPGLQWQWPANEKINWWAEIPGSGYLRLFAFPQTENSKNLWTEPNLLLQKMPAPVFTVTTKLRYTVEWDVWQGKKAGLIITGDDYAYIGISKDSIGYKVGQYECKNAANGNTETTVSETRIASAEVYFRVSVSEGARCRFSLSTDGMTFTAIGNEFQAKADKWIGSKVGIFCTAPRGGRIGGYCDFDWFRVSN